MQDQSWEGWRCGGAAAHCTPDNNMEQLLVQILILILLSWLTAWCQQGCRGIPQLPAFIIFNNFSFLIFIFCAHLVNTSGMLLRAGWPPSPGEVRPCSTAKPQPRGGSFGSVIPNRHSNMPWGHPRAQDVVQTEPQHQPVPHKEQP